MSHLRGLKSFLFTIVCFIIILVTRFAYYLHKQQFISSKNEQSTLFQDNSLLNSLYVDRNEHLLNACKGYNKKNWTEYVWGNRDLLEHILVDSRHQLLYCYVPKVACTNWKRIFMVLNGSTNETDVLSIPAHLAHSRHLYLTLNNFTSIDAQYLLATYTKFLFVRHPFERLLSAYRNKLEQNYINSKYFQSRLGRYIVKRYRAKPTNSSLMNGDDVTFEEFTAYLTKSVSSMYNEHWKPINSLCEPCTIQYDFVGKYETLLSDSNYLLKSIGISNLSFPHDIKTSSTSKDLKKYFGALSTERIKELYKIYNLDFKLFSYNLESLLGYELD